MFPKSRMALKTYERCYSLRKKNRYFISFHFASLVHPSSINLKFSSNYFFILSSWLHGFIVTLRRDESLKNLIVCVKKKIVFNS